MAAAHLRSAVPLLEAAQVFSSTRGVGSYGRPCADNRRQAITRQARATGRSECGLKVRLLDAERRSCIDIGKGHLRAVGSFAFSRKTKSFFFVSGGSWFFFSFVIYFF